MLTEICNFIHNYFEHESYSGTFTIANGTIDLDDIVRFGQRFRIVGSALNDGIYTYRMDGVYDDDGSALAELSDETFTGVVYAMSVPKFVLQVAADAAAWVEKNQSALDSPYTSESFGGYAYTKASGSGSNAGGPLSWQDVFRSKLNAYRKIS